MFLQETANADFKDPRVLEDVPGCLRQKKKKGNNLFPLKSSYEEHNDRMFEYFGHWIHTLAIIKRIKAKLFTDGGSSDETFKGAVI